MRSPSLPKILQTTTTGNGKKNKKTEKVSDLIRNSISTKDILSKVPSAV